MFKTFNDALMLQFSQMQKTGKLFRSSVTGGQLWDLYLKSFEDGTDPVFRDPASSTHTCNTCNNFMRRYGNIVTIINGSIVSIFDAAIPEDSIYAPSAKAMAKALRESSIVDIFKETFNELNGLPYQRITRNTEVFKLGIAEQHKIYTAEEAQKYGVVKAGETRTFHHFSLDLDKAYVDSSGSSIESIMAGYRDNKNVLKRGLDEIPMDTLLLVQDLISQGSLLNGDAYSKKLAEFIKLKKTYDKLSAEEKDNWCWMNCDNPFSKFRNELIGTICVELAEGKDLNAACLDWNKRADPVNYMKATAPITKRQIAEAKKFVEENGYEESFDRRHATIDDISVEEILHSNVGDGKVKTASVFDSVMASPSTRHKRSEFDKVEEVSIDKFMSEILPKCTGVELYLENRLENNLVALTTAKDKACKPLFKWSNPFSWTYNGNLAGKSEIAANVAKAGGNITGILRCSLQWNDADTPGIVDLDLHCKEKIRAHSNEIYYGSKRSALTGGWLDVDMRSPSTVGVENITWQSDLKDGEYTFIVKNFNGASNRGFKAEVEFNGEKYEYFRSKSVAQTSPVKVLTINVVKGQISIEHHLPETGGHVSRKMWGIDTNEFHKVNLVCLSPNFWGDNNVGNKHYMFMLDKCAADTPMRSFHNENLNSELLGHRKVMEVLGESTKIEPAAKQLAGVGFNATVKDEVILKLSGSFKRVIKVKF